MRQFTISTTFMGYATDVREEDQAFRIKCRSGDEVDVVVNEQTQFSFVQNLDGINRDRIANPEGYTNSVSERVKKYIKSDRLIVLEGIYQENHEDRRFNASKVNLLQSETGKFLFEDTHWWLTQIARISDTWLGYLFNNKQSYEIDDFKLYQTQLNILGLPGDDNVQECATLARLLYGLSSAYLLTGSESYLSAAKAGVQYQRETFRTLSHDGQYCFWASGKRQTKYSYELYMTSQNGDDRDAIPLYEQIYALAGLTQYYRITADWEVLEDIKRTVRTFNCFFLDRESEYGENAYGDYFSHLDYATMSWDHPALGDNGGKKNWNSIGDHIPAYLINIILALEPLPQMANGYQELNKFLNICKKILRTTTTIIIDKFPDSDPNIPFVNERFLRNWKPDQTWRWQQDRAVIGHNLKIAWNLTRVANYYYMAAKTTAENSSEAEEYEQLADRAQKLADRLGQDMAKIGVDLFRGGIFDVVERNPGNGMPLDFPWSNTKDFWQQEQAILAYLILHGCSNENQTQKQEYLHLAQEMSSFWNLFFLDRENKGFYFRVNDSGLPIIQGDYANKGGHAISGYHAFELNFLAHIYISTYVTKKTFSLHFKPGRQCRHGSLNVLPDFVKPGTLEINRIIVDGTERFNVDADNFQIDLNSLPEAETEIIVEFKPLG